MKNQCSTRWINLKIQKYVFIHFQCWFNLYNYFWNRIVESWENDNHIKVNKKAWEHRQTFCENLIHQTPTFFEQDKIYLKKISFVVFLLLISQNCCHLKITLYFSYVKSNIHCIQFIMKIFNYFWKQYKQWLL